jgi:LysM repeat protein
VNTIKTALVVVGLLAVGYGAYVVMNKGGDSPAPPISGPSPLALNVEAGAPTGAGELPWQPFAADPGNPARVPYRAEGPGGVSPAKLQVDAGPPPVAPPIPNWDRDPPRPAANDTPASTPYYPPAAAPPTYSGGAYSPPGHSQIAAVSPNGSHAFAEAWRTAQQQLEKNQLAEALTTLTPFHSSSELTAEEHRTLMSLLDKLAGTVIYSKSHHLLAQPYKVRARETLGEIARQYDVPWELLARINNVSDPQILYPGEELKIVPGPFHAEVSLAKGELTLLVGGRYAGRFPISATSAREGSYEVLRRMAPRDPSNRYGSHATELSGGLVIHGGVEGAATGAVLGVSPRDAEDIHAILSDRSKVTIRR